MRSCVQGKQERSTSRTAHLPRPNSWVKPAPVTVGFVRPRSPDSVPLRAPANAAGHRSLSRKPKTRRIGLARALPQGRVLMIRP